MAHSKGKTSTSLGHNKNRRQSMAQKGPIDIDIHVDPVCGMKLKDKDSIQTLQHRGITYYFCSYVCKDKFANKRIKKVQAP